MALAHRKPFVLVIVINEVGCSIVPENQVGRVYRDILGRVNQKVTEISDEVNH